MPEKMLARPLKFWEQICSNMGVTMAFEVEGKVTASIITGAFTHIQKEFPFLRTVLKQDKNQLSFVEATPAVELKVVEVKPLPDFHKVVVDTANTMRDSSKSVIYLELYSLGEKHILISTLNHAGMDALNGFQIYNSFFTAIGLLSAGKPLPAPKENIFADVLARIPADLKKVAPLSVPQKYMASIGPVPSAKAGDAARIEAFFTELPADISAALLKKCHDKGVTVQGAISAASAVANAAVQAKEFPLPQTLLLQCPASVRDQVTPPVTAVEGGQGASLLWWAQEVAPDQALWALAKDASTAVKKEMEAKGGLAFWVRMYAEKTMMEAMSQDTPFYNPPFTATTSSIGVNPIATVYGPIKVSRAHLMLATYGVTSPTEAGSMTHAHTFNNKLNITFTYSMPAFGEERAKLLAATQEAVLKALATGDEGATVGKFLAVDPGSLSLDLLDL